MVEPLGRFKINQMLTVKPHALQKLYFVILAYIRILMGSRKKKDVLLL